MWRAQDAYGRSEERSGQDELVVGSDVDTARHFVEIGDEDIIWSVALVESLAEVPPGGYKQVGLVECLTLKRCPHHQLLNGGNEDHQIRIDLHSRGG